MIKKNHFYFLNNPVIHTISINHHDSGHLLQNSEEANLNKSEHEI